MEVKPTRITMGTPKFLSMISTSVSCSASLHQIELQWMTFQSLAVGGVGKLNSKYPIQQIEVAAGWVVDGFTVTYRLASGQTTNIIHGTAPKNGRKIVLKRMCIAIDD